MRSTINSLLDPVVNFGKVTVSAGYSSTDIVIILSTGDGSKLPATGGFNLVWYDSSMYPDPSDDPKVEIVRCTNRTVDILTVIRGQEGTIESTKNDSGRVYKMILSPTKKTIDDIQTEYQSGVSAHASLTATHGATGAIVGTTNSQTLTNKTLTTPTIDSFVNANHTHATTGATGGTVDHVNLANKGTNTHAEIDTALTASNGHIAASGISVHGLGTMSVQSASSVAITGGNISGLTTDLAVTDGGTGRGSAVAYAPICGGTTDTDAHQSVASVGTAGQVLTSNGASALPTFQTISAGWTITSKTANFTAADDNIILCNATSSAITITLPAAASNTNKIYSIKKTDNTANTVTIDGNASETIDDALTQVISSQYDCLTIACNGTAWYII